MKKSQLLPMFFDASPKLFEFAKNNREHPTEAENMLWNVLRKYAHKGLKFRRQHPIGSYILDFYCHKAKLAIEIDGGYHQTQEQKTLDIDRQKNIETNAKIKIIRFQNEEVITDLALVLERIDAEIAAVLNGEQKE